jgi:hypothetical protein
MDILDLDFAPTLRLKWVKKKGARTRNEREEQKEKVEVSEREGVEV